MEASAIHARPGLTAGRASIGASLLRLRSDEQLVELFRAGNDEAFRAIHDRYRARLFAYVRQMLAGSSQDAEDALQDVFMRAFAGLRANDRELALRAWLYRVAHNRCIDQIRRPPPAVGLDSEPLAPAISDPVTATEQQEDLRRLVVDVGRLPEQQRSALLMRELSGMSYAELAETLDLSIPAVKSVLVRARVSLAAASAARDTDCREIRAQLIRSHDRGVKPTATARRHLRDCSGCREFRGSMRSTSRKLAVLTPVGPIGAVAKLLGLGGLLGIGGGAAAGGGGATSAAAAGSGATGAAAGGLIAGGATIGGAAGSAAGGAVAATGAAAGGGAAAAGGGAVVASAAAGSGAVAASAAAGTGAVAGHVATLIAAAVVATGGAVAIEPVLAPHHSQPARPAAQSAHHVRSQPPAAYTVRRAAIRGASRSTEAIAPAPLAVPTEISKQKNATAQSTTVGAARVTTAGFKPAGAPAPAAPASGTSTAGASTAAATAASGGSSVGTDLVRHGSVGQVVSSADTSSASTSTQTATHSPTTVDGATNTYGSSTTRGESSGSTAGATNAAGSPPATSTGGTVTDPTAQSPTYAPPTTASAPGMTTTPSATPPPTAATDQPPADGTADPSYPSSSNSSSTPIATPGTSGSATPQTPTPTPTQTPTQAPTQTPTSGQSSGSGGAGMGPTGSVAPSSSTASYPYASR